MGQKKQKVLKKDILEEFFRSLLYIILVVLTCGLPLYICYRERRKREKYQIIRKCTSSLSDIV